MTVLSTASPTTTTTTTTTATAAPTAPRRGVLQMLREADTAEQATLAAAGGGFSAGQIHALAAPLDRALVSSREQGRSQVPYLQSWLVIREANRIFGFDGWQRQTLQVQCVCQAERLIGHRSHGRDPKPGWGVTYTARVRVTVHAGERGLLIREGTGAGHGIDTDLGLAHESAIKEAETDAMKRALMTFGNPFGLALYDKSQREVSGAAQPRAAQPLAAQPRAVLPAAAPAASPAPAPRPDRRQAAGAAADLTPLPATTIQQVHATIRTLAPAQLEAFSAAFRRRFQVPAQAVAIAGLIRQKQHHDWIEAWLVRQAASPAPAAASAAATAG
ncbi:MAG: RAD52 family DNA repair protein [Prochlorococcaceae cyanobacterium]